MKKQLLTVGDSFTHGDELTDRYQAWPYRLADKLGYEVYNMGQSGCSNFSILRRTLEEIAVNHYDLIVIGWTSPGRIEWKDDIGIAYDLWPGYSANHKFFEDHPWRDNFFKFISQHHNSSYLYEQYIIHVVSLQSYCHARGIDYRMINVRHNDYYHKVGKEPHEQLAKQIDKEKFIGWDKFGMMELTNDLPQGPGGHPLEAGHERIANEIYTGYISRVS
jgi:lysophospholipase L1-like esterase